MATDLAPVKERQGELSLQIDVRTVRDDGKFCFVDTLTFGARLDHRALVVNGKHACGVTFADGIQSAMCQYMPPWKAQEIERLISVAVNGSAETCGVLLLDADETVNLSFNRPLVLEWRVGQHTQKGTQRT
jgi:hypothetical protein